MQQGQYDGEARGRPFVERCAKVDHIFSWKDVTPKYCFMDFTRRGMPPSRPIRKLLASAMRHEHNCMHLP